ncbi:MAG: hypothetical protein ACE5FS_03250 [Paracoccaceae bacterium]
MREILILSETQPPAALGAALRWPGVRISVAGGLTVADMVERLGGSGAYDAVIVETAARSARLTAAVKALPCRSAEVLRENPWRNADGSPNFDARPAGADCMVFGLGTAGYEVAVDLLSAQFGKARQ